MQNSVKYHLLGALCGALAEAAGDENLSRHLRAETRLRLVKMSDKELRELAELTSCSPARTFEQSYREFKQAREENRVTASQWINDLVSSPMPDVAAVDDVLPAGVGHREKAMAGRESSRHKS